MKRSDLLGIALAFAIFATLPTQAQNTNNEIAFADKRASWMQKAEDNMPKLQESIIRPKCVVKGVADESAFQGWRMEPTDESIEQLCATSLRQRKEVILDLGDHYTGYFSFDVNLMGMPADAPLRFRLTFGEVPAELNTPFDPYPGSLSRAWLQDEVLTVMQLPGSVELERRVACRYIKIEILATSYYDFTINNIEFRAVTSATGEPLPLAEGTDPMIRRINEVGLKTLAECMQTVYEDGPKRDERLWIGDLYLEALANAYSFKNHALTRRCLYLLAGMSDEEGWLHATVYERPTPQPQVNQHVGDYSLLYCVALHEYLNATGDKETAEDLWEVAKRQIEFLSEGYLKDNIYDMEKQPGWWLVFDWKNELNRHAPMQGVFIFALDHAYQLAQKLGKQSEVEHWAKQLKDMRKAAREYFYDKKQGVVVSGADKQISHLSQVWFILGDVLTAKEGEKALQSVLSSPTACYPGSPYAYHYLIEAMLKCGMTEQARELLIEYWGGMIERGADTFWEVYDPNEPTKSPYNFHPINSYCHAWSCTPVYFINKYKDIFQR